MSSKMAAIQKQLEKAGVSSTVKKVVPLKPLEPAASDVSADDKPAKKPAPGGRDNKVHVGAYLHPDFKSGVMMVRAKTGMDVTETLAAALNDLFRAHGVPVVDSDKT